MIKGFIPVLHMLVGSDVSSTEFTLLHMTTRAIIFFTLGIILTRLNSRFISISASFDFILRVLIGSLAANSITGSAPFFASLGLIIIIWLIDLFLAMATFYFPRLEQIIKGTSKVIIHHGKLQHKIMKRNLISQDDIIEALHKYELTDVREVKVAFLENDGNITVIPYKHTQASASSVNQE